MQTDEGIEEFGKRGRKIHLYRNYKNWSEIDDVKKDFESLLPLPIFLIKTFTMVVVVVVIGCINGSTIDQQS